MEVRKRLVGCLALFLLWTAPCLAEEKTDATVVKGTVEASEFNDEGEVLAVSIFSEQDGDFYYVAGEGKGKDLLKHVGATVEVQGTVQSDEDGEKTLVVADFKVVVEEAPDAEPLPADPEPAEPQPAEPEPAPAPAEPAPEEGEGETESEGETF